MYQCYTWNDVNSFPLNNLRHTFNRIQKRIQRYSTESQSPHDTGGRHQIRRPAFPIVHCCICWCRVDQAHSRATWTSQVLAMTKKTPCISTQAACMHQKSTGCLAAGCRAFYRPKLCAEKFVAVTSRGFH